MRYSPEHKAATRQRILETASRVFRERGSTASVPEIMRAAGLTVGGFYRHFESKEELFREATALALEETTQRLRGRPAEEGGEEWMRRAAAIYLHPAHRENVASGCPVPVLTSEVARGDAAGQEAYERGLLDLVEALAERLPEAPVSTPPREHAWGFLATLAGGLLLSRGVADDELAAEILRASRRAAVQKPVAIDSLPEEKA